jgi:hypothetical protein
MALQRKGMIVCSILRSPDVPTLRALSVRAKQDIYLALIVVIRCPDERHEYLRRWIFLSQFDTPASIAHDV